MTPEQIINRSRMLEGVGVDLGEDRGPPEFLVTRLRHYAQTIRNNDLTPSEFASTVEKYNEVLYIYVCDLEFHQSTLDDELRIREEYTLIEYLKYAQRLKEHGPYTFEMKIDDSDYVGVIEVKSKSLFTQGKMKIAEHRRFKGSTQPRVTIAPGWGNEYVVGNKYLVLWHDREVVSFHSKERMKIVEEGRKQRVLCGWPSSLIPFPSREFDTYESIFDLDDFRQWYESK